SGPGRPAPTRVEGPAPPPPAPSAAPAGAPTPPLAKREAKVTRVHGQDRVDEYAWLQKKGDPEVEAYLAAENAYVDAVMRPTEALQEAVYRELLGRVPPAERDLPVRHRGWLYYDRTEAGKQHGVFCRKRPGEGAAEQVLLDYNELGGAAIIYERRVSDDGNLLAYALDTKGSYDFRLYVKDLRTGKLLADGAERVHSLAWAADNKTLFYTVEDEAHRPYRLYRHALGAPASADALVLEEPDERFRVNVWRTRSDAFVLAESRSKTTSEVRALPAGRPGGEFRTIWPRRQGVTYTVDHRGDSFYLRTDDRGPNGRIVAVPVADPAAPAKLKELVPHRDDVTIEQLEAFRDYYVVFERRDALPRLRVFDYAKGPGAPVAFPEPVYSLDDAGNRDFAAPAFRYEYVSYLTPRSTYELDVKSGQSRLLERRPVPNYDPSAYALERTWATAPDGARVPISVVYKKGVARDGKAPLYLRGYSAYGWPSRAHFAGAQLPLLDRGVVFAWAHARGSGDLGKAWHEGGRMMKKRNTFSDFIAAAEHLVAERYAAPGRVAIGGHSAGGMLVGAVLNRRPELFRAAVAEAPFVDVITSMFNEKNAGTVSEYEEWGNPNEKAAYDEMMTYSPYDNVKAQAYPALLVTAAYNDTNVLYHEPAKWVARLRARKTDQNPLLFRTEMGAASHGGKSGRFDALREQAFKSAFLLWQLGVDAP
ncbi:MAG TPA: S9 family peptidase, partial [Polyangiaceae bacterium]|nr:S9 family peptidase [Polyangiaceae bacterium]